MTNVCSAAQDVQGLALLLSRRKVKQPSRHGHDERQVRLEPASGAGSMSSDKGEGTAVLHKTPPLGEPTILQRSANEKPA